MKLTGIYKIQSISHPERCYIGSAIDIDRRWRDHLWQLKNNRHYSSQLQNHFNKYGKEDLRFLIVEQFEFVSKKHLTDREDAYLTPLPYFNNNPKANSRLGSKSTKEVCDKISKALKGKNTWSKNRKVSKETCDKMSKSKMGHFTPEETKRKIGEANRKHGVLFYTGHTPWNKGKINAYTVPTRKPIFQYDKNMNFIKEWDSTKRVTEELHINNLSRCLYGKCPKAGGFIWRFKSDILKVA